MSCCEQFTSAMSREAYAEQANAEEAVETRKREHLSKVGYWAEHEAQKAAIGPLLVGQHKRHGPHRRERCHCREARGVGGAGPGFQGDVRAQIHAQTHRPKVLWTGTRC